MSDSHRPGENSDEETTALDRRSLLKLAGATAGTAALGTLPGTVAADYQSVLETSELGGRYNYSDSSRPTAGNYEPTTESELRNALASASGGEVIYVPGDATIEVTVSNPYDLYDYLEIPADVTLASDRGINGNPGGLITIDQRNNQFLRAQSGVRVTGIRLDGPEWDWVKHKKWGGPEWSRGIGLDGSGVVVDNCEITGWGHYGLAPDNDHEIHHCHVHHNPMEGLGYGVESKGGYPEIHHNVFNHNRHGVATREGWDAGYELHDNFFGGKTIGHIVDAHPDNTRLDIYNNTIGPVEQEATSKESPNRVSGVMVRGTPQEQANIHHNWFLNPALPVDDPDADFDDEAISVAETSTYANISWWDNHYGSDEPASNDVGAPVDGQSGSDGEGGGDGSDGSDGGTDGSTHFEITTVSDTGDFRYKFTVDGSSVTRDTSNGDDSAESTNDSITDNGDGTYTVSGKAGNGYGDSYHVDGEVTSWAANYDQSMYTLYFDGMEIDPNPLIGTHFEITTVADSGDFRYEFTVDGPVVRDETNGDDSAETSNDSITANGDGTYAVSGKAGNGYGDSYYVNGEVTSWTANLDQSQYTLYFDGTEVDPAGLGGDDLLVVDRDPDSSGKVSYMVRTDGSIEQAPSDAPGALNSGDEIDGDTAYGAVSTGNDPYLLVDASEVEVLSHNGEVRTTLNGEVVDLTVDRDELVIERAPDSSGKVSYMVRTDGTLEPAPSAAPGGLNGTDEIDGNTAHGIVSTGRDSYSVVDASEVEVLSHNGEVKTTLNGHDVDLTADWDQLVIDRHPDSDGVVEYIIETDGTIEPAGEVAPGQLNSADDIAGNQARGSVRTGNDPYRLVGASKVQVLSFNGEVRTVLNAEDVDLTEYTGSI